MVTHMANDQSAPVASQHFPVVASLSVSPSLRVFVKQQPSLDWVSLKDDNDIQRVFVNEDARSLPVDEHRPSWEHLQQTANIAALNVVPRKDHIVKKP